MIEVELCQQSQNGDDWHSRWLAMQSAYAEYRRSSEVLECTRQSVDGSLSSDNVQLTLMEGQQRLAFERYMEARIAFLESRFDEMNRPDMSDGVQSGRAAAEVDKPRGVIAWLSAASSRPVLETLALTLLCTMTFSLMWAQKRVRNLEADGEELRAALGLTVREVQLLRGRLDAVETPAAPPSRHIQQIPQTPAPLKPFAAQRRSAGKGQNEGTKQKRLSRQAAAASRAPVREMVRYDTGYRSTSDFSISPTRKFRRVGPLSVLLRSVDSGKNTASLSITSETVEVGVPHLRIGQPVWINTSHNHRVGLVADRIAKNRLDGHLLDAENAKPDLGASHIRPRAGAGGGGAP